MQKTALRGILGSTLPKKRRRRDAGPHGKAGLPRRAARPRPRRAAGPMAAAATTFTWATANDILGLDPHANNHGVTNAMKSNVYEPLVRREPDGSLAPALAERWEAVSPTLWRFHLRRNVRFHGGEAFTAADVVHSIERVRQSDMAYTAQSIAAARAVDDATVEIETRGPNPVLLQDLTLLFITSRPGSRRTTPSPWPAPARRAPPAPSCSSTPTAPGPFRVVERLADERTVLVPNPGWWEPAQHGITRAVFRPVASAPTRVAALLSRELDVMYHVPLQDIPRIGGAPGVRLLQGPDGALRLSRLRHGPAREPGRAGHAQPPARRAGAARRSIRRST
jgi:peptide/nickel transport system substrate-binding protein